MFLTYVILIILPYKNSQTMKKTLFFALLLFNASCSQKSGIFVPVAIDTEKQLLEEIKQQPDITAKVIEQIPFKKMEIVATIGTGANTALTSYNYDFDYYANGKIKIIRANNKDFITIDYIGSQVTVNQNNIINKYELGNDNLVKNTVSGNEKFYYKNGYLLRNISSEPILKRTYTTGGNLLISETTPTTATAVYEYYDYPNNIRQEILKSEAIHWSFRDDYLGKFSTNLLKKVTFINSGTTLDFTYQFDSNSRVEKMIIDRTVDKSEIASGKFQYTFSY